MYSYLSASEAKNQARRAANLRVLRVVSSYREAARLGYYSIKRLRALGLEVRDSERSNYSFAVESRGCQMPVYSKSQCVALAPAESSSPRADAVVQIPRVEEESESVGVEILFPVEVAAPRQQDRPRPQSEVRKRRCRGRAKPQSTGYFIDTPENLEIPESHLDVENEIRLILHVVKAGIDQHRHHEEGVAHYNHPLGKRLMGSPLEQKAYRWLIDTNALICANHSYSHRPDDPKGSFSKSYYIHCRYANWRKWEISKHRLAAKLLLAQSRRQDLRSPKRELDTEATSNGHAALCGQNCPVPGLLTITDAMEDKAHEFQVLQPDTEATANGHAALCGLIRPVRELLTNHLIRQNLNLRIDWDKAQKILDEEPEADRKQALATAMQIGDPKANYTTCDYGRFHAPISRLFSPLRQAVYFKSHPQSKKIGWDLRNSQILHLVKAYKEDRYTARAGSRSTEPFFGSREQEFFKLVEEGWVYDYYFAKAQQECPQYMVAKIRRTKQRAAWAELWKRYLESLLPETRPKDKREQQAHRRKLLRKHPIKGIPVGARQPTRDDFKQILFADVFYGRAVVDTPVTKLFETHHPEILRWIRQQKARGHAELARKMQRAESDMMIGAVVRRLLEHHPEVPFYTVHDSITTVQEHGELVGRILREEYNRAGLHPALKRIEDAA